MNPEHALLSATGDAAARIAHREALPARDPGPAPDVTFAPEIAARLRRAGIERLWSHQAAGIEAARAGRHVAVATGTASGKSLVYQIATFERLLASPSASALYLFPTKALAQDQVRRLRSFALPAVRAAVYDGDTPSPERAWVRRNANVVVTNPDMLHLGILPAHAKWAPFFRGLQVVVVDEMHMFRGVFGSHVANVLRRLRRVAARYGASPLFVAASATIGNPAELGGRLTGLPFEAIAEDGSPRGEKTFLLWNPPADPDDPADRRSTTAEAAEIVAALVAGEVHTIAFARSRRAAELVASFARDRLHARPDLARRVAAYRAGYLPEERRELERRLTEGDLMAVAATTALELGIDVGGLDACVLAGYPGTVAGTWQQAGRAGRGLEPSLAVLIAGDDPLDQYVASHPETIFGRPHEAAVVDHTNPSILDAHLGCAAFELPLGPGDEALFGDEPFAAGVERLTAAGLLRPRGSRMHWAGDRDPAAAVDIRSAGGIISIVEEGTGTLLGTVDEARAPHAVHAGAFYLHQGEQYEVSSLDLDRRVALVERSDADVYTQPRDVTDIRILATERVASAGRADLFYGRVEVVNQVVAYARRMLHSGELLGVVPLDLPAQRLETRAMWLTVPDELLEEAKLSEADVPGAAHAAEHAAIGLMPLIAMCDRWDIGGVSTAMMPDTGMCTIFIHDGYPGGVGIAERGFEAGERLLRATLDTIEGCRCEAGCPSCVQSPKCGNGNEPLDKAGAARLLSAVLGRRAPG